MKTLKEPLCGIVPPLVTPLLGRDQLDVSGLERLIERVLGGGVHGVFISEQVSAPSVKQANPSRAAS